MFKKIGLAIGACALAFSALSFAGDKYHLSIPKTEIVSEYWHEG